MRSPHAEDGFFSSRRYFWVFVAIFSVTVFCASTQIAARYCTYVETTRRVSQPGDLAPASSTVAGGEAGTREAATVSERSIDTPVRSHS